MARDAGFEPATFGSGGDSLGLPAITKSSQTLGIIQPAQPSTVQNLHALTTNSKKFAAYLLQGGAGALLSVRDVAARLNVSTATVYRLCDAGVITHLRVSNTIRVTPEALREFISSQCKERSP